MSFAQASAEFRNTGTVFQRYAGKVENPATRKLLAEHAINAQAAKIEVLAREYKSFLGDHYWTKQMIAGLDQALLASNLSIEEVQPGETKDPLHSKSFTRLYITPYKASNAYKNSERMLGGLPTDEASKLALKTLLTLDLQIQVAKVATLIEDFISVTDDTRIQRDAIQSINFSLQLNGHQLAPAKAKNLFVQLALKSATPEMVETKVRAPINALLADLVDQDTNLIAPSLMEKVDQGKYDPEIMAYVQQLLKETDSLEAAKAKLASHEASFMLIVEQRAEDQVKLTEKKGDLVALLTEEVKALSNRVTEEGTIELEEETVEIDIDMLNEQLVTMTETSVQHAIDTSTKDGLFSMNAFAMRYSHRSNPFIFKYISTISSLVGTRNLNSEQTKRQVRAHFHKMQLLAKENDQQVRAKRQGRKDSVVREERIIEERKMLESSKVSASAAQGNAKIKSEEKSLLANLFAFFRQQSTKVQAVPQNTY